MKFRLKDVILAISLSNLCFITAWRALLFPSSFFYYYHQKNLPPTTEYLALLLDVVLLAAIFFLGIVLTRRSQNEWVKKCSSVLFIIILSVPLYGILMELDHPSVRKLMLPIVSDDKAKRILSSIGLTVVLFALALMLLRIQRASKIAVATILILAPLVPLTFSQAVLTAIKYRHAGSDQIPAAVVPQSGSRPRVLWLIFDELDFRTAFDKRPESVALPELDRLAADSLVSVNAYPPAGETFLTLPSLITGRLVSYAERRGPDELLVRFGEDSASVSWRSQPNVFSRAREAGFNTALMGWYHPYCRILGSHLTKCSWEGKSQLWEADTDDAHAGFSPPPAAGHIRQRMYRHAVLAARAIPLWNFIFKQRPDEKAVVGRKLSVFESIYRQALDAASDPEMGLVMVHWPIPHPPSIYDRASNRISVSSEHSYLDNLALVDRTLGEIRRSMEEKGIWDSTVVLVTSDHWWRTNYWKEQAVWTEEDQANAEATLDRRIPFILKMSGARDGISYEPPFNTVLTHDLLLAVLRGEVSDAKDAAAWLDRNRSIARSPYDEHTYR